VKGIVVLEFKNYIPLMNPIAFISDIHGNIDALDAVLSDLKKRGIDEILCLGDIVGYGGAPRECVDKVIEVCSHTVVGNHDFITFSSEPLNNAPSHVVSGIEFAKLSLSPSHVLWLSKLPFLYKNDFFTTVHSSLGSPSDFEYLLTGWVARSHFKKQSTPISFIGHTHSPVMTVENNDRIEWVELNNDEIAIPAEKVVINVGSVGQPRDNDPRACYCIFYPDFNKFKICRVDYDIEKARSRIIKAGISKINADRLCVGN
jgi:predicted phosphodiesterase